MVFITKWSQFCSGPYFVHLVWSGNRYLFCSLQIIQGWVHIVERPFRNGKALQTKNDKIFLKQNVLISMAYQTIIKAISMVSFSLNAVCSCLDLKTKIVHRVKEIGTTCQTRHKLLGCYQGVILIAQVVHSGWENVSWQYYMTIMHTKWPYLWSMHYLDHNSC